MFYILHITCGLDGFLSVYKEYKYYHYLRLRQVIWLEHFGVFSIADGLSVSMESLDEGMRLWRP